MPRLDGILEQLRAAFPDSEVRLDEPMRAHTSFKIGGTVPALFLPKREEELALIRRLLRETDMPVLIIGNGTNLLVSDGQLHMVVVQLCDGLGEMKLIDDETIWAGSGALLSRIATFALQNGLTGFEFAHGIPGSFGGAISMNAGAYGGEMKDVVTRVRSMDPEGNIRETAGTDCDFSYRHSCFSDTEEIILSGEIHLKKGDPSEIRAKMEELSCKRRTSQPLNMPSAGSTFKRPVGGYAAAMIDEAGLRGYSIGGAQVSEKHCGFVINKGDATFDDVCRLMAHIQGVVFEKFGTTLQPEVKIIR